MPSLFNMNPSGLSTIIEFLTAMITPALLISASGSLVLSTSTRLGRVIDRARDLIARLDDLILMENKDSMPYHTRRLEANFDLLDKVTSRARILQRAMVAFYRGLALYVLTSVSIGISILIPAAIWIPVPVGIIGILFTFYGSLLMMWEAGMATTTVNTEMDYTWEIAKKLAPKELAGKYKMGKNHELERTDGQ
ncbi:MAG TPA: DUF2721 domain-containing protein [Pyrinomonadaceae bacterium]|nr:DUF2721 domain-containing protein [Pyrinomonadaceae bacterium]